MGGADGSSPPRRLTAGPRDGAPRWSPDGSTLAFLRPKDGRAQLYLLPLGGGEAQQLTDLPKGASAAAWSPDGKTIASTSPTTPEDLAKKDKTEEPKSDVRIITLAEFRADDEGYLDPGDHTHTWTGPAGRPGDEPAKPRQVTSGAFDEEAPQWSRDGARVSFISDRRKESYYYSPDNNVYSVPVAGGGSALDTVVDIDGPVFGPAPAPDGKAVAFRGWLNPRAARSYNQSDLFVSRGGRAKNLTADYDFDMGTDVIGDQAPPRGGGGSSPAIWTADGKSVIVTTTEHGRSNLVRFDAQSGAREPVTTGDHAVLAYTATPDGRRFVLTMGDPTHLADAYTLDAQTKRLTQLTHVNDSLLAKRQLVTPEDFWYPSFDGKKIETWIMKPVGFTLGKKYPLILNIHGGLLTDWTVGHTHRFAAAASQRDVADWLSFWYTADFTLFQPSWFRSTPFRDPEEFLARSPVRYADSVTTPLMFILGDADLRTPPTQGGEAMFRALKYLHRTTVQVRFPGESHELSRSGKPVHRVERLQHILNWFDKYLQGKPITQYDTR